MKKLETQILQNVLFTSKESDLMTVRQGETLKQMERDGLIRIERFEQIKANLIICEYKLGTVATAKAAMNASQSSEETQTESEGESQDA